MQLNISPVTGSRSHLQPEVLDFIRSQFLTHYGAAISDIGSNETLYDVRDSFGRLHAAFTLNRQPKDFFCRHYIGDIATALADNFKDQFQHATIVELSHLALRTPKSLCLLNPYMVEFLSKEADFVVCTVIQPIAEFFRRKNFAPVPLGAASLDALPLSQQGQWGSYYQKNPVVVCGDLTHACAVTQIAA